MNGSGMCSIFGFCLFILFAVLVISAIKIFQEDKMNEVSWNSQKKAPRKRSFSIVVIALQIYKSIAFTFVLSIIISMNTYRFAYTFSIDRFSKIVKIDCKVDVIAIDQETATRKFYSLWARDLLHCVTINSCNIVANPKTA